MRKDPSSFQQDPDNTVIAMQGRPTVTRQFDTVAGELAGVGERAAGWLAEQAHQGLSEAVSRILGLNEHAHDPAKDKAQEQSPERGMDR